jgi:GTP-binding protein
MGMGIPDSVPHDPRSDDDGATVKIRTVEYAGTLATPDGPMPGDLPQVAFSGRSNVGKSSLINLVLRRHRSKIAHVSGQPGKTQAVNFYRVNDHFFLVDLPGFGYAKVPKKLRDQWKGLVEGYLSRSEGLRGVVHLVDCRREPTPQDLEMLDYLAELGIPTLVVLTKVDKLKSAQRERAFRDAREKLGIDAEQMVAVSSRTGEGRETLLEAITTLLEEE